MPIVHLETAILPQGDATFGWQLKSLVLELADQAPDLEALVEDVPEVAQAVWGSVPANDNDGTCFLVGYSPRAGRFVAWRFAAEHDFEAHEITGLHVMPSPFTMRPSNLELERTEASNGAIQPESIAMMRAKPAPVPPRGAQWIALGRLAREHRLGTGIKTGLKVAVAGHLIHTHVSRGKVSTKKVFTFDDSGPEFQKMVEGTYHPRARPVPVPVPMRQRPALPRLPPRKAHHARGALDCCDRSDCGH